MTDDDQSADPPTSDPDHYRVVLENGQVRWLPAPSLVGENIGAGPTHAFFAELKEPGPTSAGSDAASLGPAGCAAPPRGAP